MTWSGGTYTRPGGATAWADDRDAGTGITSALHDTHDEDLATGLENCITRDGQNAASADLPMGGFRFTEVGATASRTSYLTASSFQRNSIFSVLYTGASSTTYTGSLPALTAYANGMIVILTSTTLNSTTTPTLNLNSLGAKTITKATGALAVGEFGLLTPAILIYNSSGGGTFEMINPRF